MGRLFPFHPRRLRIVARNRPPLATFDLRIGRRRTVRYRELNETRRRQIRYGALTMAVILLAAGLIFLSHGNPRSSASSPSTSGAASPPTVAAAAVPAVSAEDESALTNLQRDEVISLIADARRQAAAGNFAEADASLRKAAKAVPNYPETEQARRDIERLQTPEGGLASLLQRARLAIEHDDVAGAEAAIAEATRLNPAAPEIAELRAALQQSQQKATRRERQIAEALTRMREAVARRDFAAADRALNEAERIDIQNPSIRRARGELARARGAAEQPVSR